LTRGGVSEFVSLAFGGTTIRVRAARDTKGGGRRVVARDESSFRAGERREIPLAVVVSLNRAQAY